MDNQSVAKSKSLAIKGLLAEGCGASTGAFCGAVLGPNGDAFGVPDNPAILFILLYI